MTAYILGALEALGLTHSLALYYREKSRSEPPF